MNGLALFFLIFFGIGAAIPTMWAFGYYRKNHGFWPCLLGVAFVFVLGLFTIFEMIFNWGGCPTKLEATGSSEGAVKCATRDTVSTCEPDVWRVECGQASSKCPGLAPNTFCPPGQKPVFPFCERIQTGGVKQPWATWSDVSFVAAGLWLLWFLHYYYNPNASGDDEETNPMKRIGWLSVTYGMIVIFMGPPSMWFHSSMKDWAGWFDSMSVVIWLAFNAAYVLFTLLYPMWGKKRGAVRTWVVLGMWLGLIIIIGIIGAANAKLRLLGYFISGGLWGIAEMSYLFHLLSDRVTHRRNFVLILINIALLGGTMLLWSQWHDGLVAATTCQSRENIPGHAIFHIMASLSTVLTYATFVTEKRA